MASLLDTLARPAAVLQLSVLLGVTFVLLKVLQFYWERKKIFKALEAFPGPPKHWLHGHNHLVRSELGSGRVGLSQPCKVSVGMRGTRWGVRVPAPVSSTGEDFCTEGAEASAGQEERVLDMWCA